MSQQPIITSSPFVLEWIARLAGGEVAVPPPRPSTHRSGRPGLVEARRALDVAMGRGRHALPLARAGFRTFGVDVKFDAVRDAVTAAAAEGMVIRAWCADLTRHPLPAARFELVLVTRYLQRDLFPALRDALVSGGVVLYETFTTAQRALGVGPTSPDHLLQAGELRRHFDDFEIVFYEEVSSPEAVARLVARKESLKSEV